MIRLNAKYNIGIYKYCNVSYHYISMNVIGIYKYCIGIHNVSYHYISMNVLYIMLVINT